MVQLRCGVTDVCAPRAGWAHPAEPPLPPLRGKGLSASSAPLHRGLSEVSISTEGWAGSRSSGGLIGGQVIINCLEMMKTQGFISRWGKSSGNRKVLSNDIVPPKRGRER